MPTLIDSDAAWKGIAQLYAAEGAQEALLKRQDTEGLDVVLHLFVQWAESQGHAFDTAALRQADALVASWRDQVVKPLRELRRAMKSTEGGVTTARQVTRQAAREKVKAAELAAERAELQLLCDWLAAR